MLNIDSLKNLMKVEESDTDVYIYIGFKRICAIHEDDGRWYPEIDGREILCVGGFDSKQSAIDGTVRYLTV